jgi:exosortase K
VLREPAAGAARTIGGGVVKTGLIIVAAAIIAWGLKHHYAGAQAEDLKWILRPTTELVSAVTRERFTWQAGEGYFSSDRLFLIGKSCAGINFMVAAFGMLVLARCHRSEDAASVLRILAVSLLASYVAAVTVNALRIAIALRLAAHPASLSSLRASDMHRLEGIAIYFGGLVLLQELVRRLDRRAFERHAFRRTALPLVSYYAVTLAVPVANGAAQSGAAFVKHAITVLVVPPIAIVLACLIMLTKARCLRTRI